MKWYFYETESWWNGALTKWQIEEMADWQNSKLMKWQIYNNASLWNGISMKQKVGEMAHWQNGKLTKQHVDEMASWWNDLALFPLLLLLMGWGQRIRKWLKCSFRCHSKRLTSVRERGTLKPFTKATYAWVELMHHYSFKLNFSQKHLGPML